MKSKLCRDDDKILLHYFFFFKQKTAYEIGTGDWSSDVCSSDLYLAHNSYNSIGKSIDYVHYNNEVKK